MIYAIACSVAIKLVPTGIERGAVLASCECIQLNFNLYMSIHDYMLLTAGDC